MFELEHGLRPQPRATRVATDVDVKGLANYLRRRIRGEVRFDAGSRAIYSTAAANYRQVPIGVVVAREIGDVEMQWRAAGASMRQWFSAEAVRAWRDRRLMSELIDTSKYLREILALDPHQKRARVQPWVVLDQLRSEAAKFQLPLARIRPPIITTPSVEWSAITRAGSIP